MKKHIFGIILFFNFSQICYATCYRHLQELENSEDVFKIEYSRERQVLHSGIKQMLDSSLIPAELPYLAEKVGLQNRLSFMGEWVQAAIQIRSEQIKKNPEKISFLLEDAAVIQNRLDMKWGDIPDPELEFSYNRTPEEDMALKKGVTITQIRNQLFNSQEIPFLYNFWKSLDGDQRDLDIIHLAKILLLSNRYELICPRTHVAQTKTKDEISYQLMSYENLKLKILQGDLIKRLRSLGHLEIPYINPITKTSIPTLGIGSTVSVVSMTLQWGKEWWNWWNALQKEVAHKRGTTPVEFQKLAQDVGETISSERQLAIQRLILEDAFYDQLRHQCLSDSEYYFDLLNGKINSSFHKKFLDALNNQWPY